MTWHYWDWGETGLSENEQETVLSVGKLSELTCTVFSYFFPPILFAGGDEYEKVRPESLEFTLLARFEAGGSGKVPFLPVRF